LPLAWSPKKSVLQQTISAIRPESWEAVNRACWPAQAGPAGKARTVRSTARYPRRDAHRRQRAVVGCRQRHDPALAASRGNCQERRLSSGAIGRLAKKRAPAIEYSAAKPTGAGSIVS